MSTTAIDGAATASKRDLARGMGIAALVAGVVLTTAVLPAEYGIDPTGIGKALGLTALHSPEKNDANKAPPGRPAQETAVAVPVAASPGTTIAFKQVTPYRTDTKQVTLQPGEGTEIKTDLKKGETLIYSWATKNGEKINHEFHGEPINAKDDEYESYIKERGVSESRGSLIASFSGTHGWFWRNRTDKPVTIDLKASGFYTRIERK